MSRPTYVNTPLQSGMEGWDANVNDELSALAATVLEAPFPAYQHAGNQTDLATTFAAASYDRCLVWVNHTSLGWVLYYSDGTSWRIYGRAAAQADSVAANVADLRTDFNALLAKMRAAGLLGAPTP